MRIIDRTADSENIFYSPDHNQRFVVKNGILEDMVYRRISLELKNGNDWVNGFVLRQEQSVNGGEVRSDIYIKIREATEIKTVHLSDNYSSVVERRIKVKNEPIETFLYEPEEIEKINVLETAYSFLNQLMSVRADKFKKRPIILKKKI